MNDAKITAVPCPQCKTKVIWSDENPFRPFCSKQCQLIDLGEWADEEKRIPSTAQTSNSDSWSDDDY